MKVKLWGFLLITILAVNCSNLKREKDVITSSNTSVVKNTPENEISENVNESIEQNDSQIKEPDEKNDGSITGTWKHISSAKSPGGERKPLTQAAITWTFNKDGTGVYKQDVKVIKGGDGTRKFKWELKGKDIILSPGGVSYTIVDQTPNQMIWKNNRLGDYYIVEKQ